MRGTSTLDEQAVGALQTQAARRPRLKQVSWPTIALFLLPALLLYVLFVIYPVLQSVRFSFWDWNGLTAPTPVGLDNFARAFADPDFVEAMTHNGIIIVLSLLLQLPVALGGYNAGVAAVERWLPPRPIDNDVWIENIPYNETRTYVQRVLWHSVVFAWLESGEAQKTGHWLGKVRRP